jgi:hypothetical protein
MLQQVHEAQPETTVIGTNNAEVNAPILSINARVGFKVALRNVDYQMTRHVLDEWGRAVGDPRATRRWTAGLGPRAKVSMQHSSGRVLPPSSSALHRSGALIDSPARNASARTRSESSTVVDWVTLRKIYAQCNFFPPLALARLPAQVCGRWPAPSRK